MTDKVTVEDIHAFEEHESMFRRTQAAQLVSFFDVCRESYHFIGALVSIHTGFDIWNLRVHHFIELDNRVGAR